MQIEKETSHLVPPYTDEPGGIKVVDVEKGPNSAFHVVESFVMDCSDGDEDSLMSGGRQRPPCRWQQAVKVKDYGMWNMCACLCCCWLVAIGGLYKSLKAQSAKRGGQPVKAQRYSRQARIFFWVSFCLGLIVYILVAAIYGFVIFQTLSMLNHNQSRLQEQNALNRFGIPQTHGGNGGADFPQAQP